jgi:hypothetical protein
MPQNRVDLLSGRGMVFFEPFFSFLNCPSFVFFEKVAYDFSGVFACWFAYYGFDGLR